MNESKESVVDTLFDVGESWASHGLKLAESVLQQSAKTLTTVSALLGNLAAQLEHERPEAHKDVIDVQS
jgi:hypothetical protein